MCGKRQSGSKPPHSIGSGKNRKARCRAEGPGATYKPKATAVPPWEHGGLPIAFTQQRLYLLLRMGVGPGGYLRVQDVEGECAIAEDLVVEGAQVEFVAELLAGGLAQF